MTANISTDVLQEGGSTHISILPEMWSPAYSSIIPTQISMKGSLLECLQQPLFEEYHKGQPFNHNHLRPCPMLENPELLGEMVKRAALIAPICASRNPHGTYSIAADPMHSSGRLPQRESGQKSIWTGLLHSLFQIKQDKPEFSKAPRRAEFLKTSFLQKCV